MKTILKLAVAAMISGTAAQAGDPVAGEQQFRQCQTCHVVQNEAGEVLAGRAAKTGPNLYGIVGKQAGSVEGFRYRPSIVAAGEAGLVWTEETLVAYMEDPNTFLRETLNDPSARSGMTYRARSGAEDLAAFLATFSE